MTLTGSLEINTTATLSFNRGGSSPFASDAQISEADGSGSMMIKEVPEYLWEYMYGATISRRVAESTGFISSPVAIEGNLIDPATGIDSISITTGEETDLKFNRYWVEAVSATEVNIYAASSVDFNTGTPGFFYDNDQAINSTPITISDGLDTVVAGYGLTLTGGTLVSLNVGDCFYVDVRPINSGGFSVTVDNNYSPKNFAFIAYTQRKSDGTIGKLTVFKAISGGFPLSWNEKAFHELSIDFTMLACKGNGSLYNFDVIRGNNEGFC